MMNCSDCADMPREGGSMEILHQPDGSVRLQGALHISDAEELRAALLGEVTSAATLTLDLSGVESCDTASFQLLCSVQKSARDRNKEFHISALPVVMREAAATKEAEFVYGKC
jgi:anti-anti-sigma regulatory factor